MIIFSVLLGLMTIYYMRRQKANKRILKNNAQRAREFLSPFFIRLLRRGSQFQIDRFANIIYFIGAIRLFLSMSGTS